MIHDSLLHCARYQPMHPIFRDAFDYLEGLMRSISNGAAFSKLSMETGRREVIPGRLWLIVEETVGRGMENSPLEAHRQMIDIQLVLRGRERIGWRSYSDCEQVSQAYSEERDIEFFADTPTTWQDLLPGQFCIFFPKDAHAPLAGTGPVTKAIAKVATE